MPPPRGGGDLHLTQERVAVLEAEAMAGGDAAEQVASLQADLESLLRQREEVLSDRDAARGELAAAQQLAAELQQQLQAAAAGAAEAAAAAGAELQQLQAAAGGAEQQQALAEALQQQNEVLAARLAELEAAAAAAAAAGGGSGQQEGLLADLQRENQTLQVGGASRRRSHC